MTQTRILFVCHGNICRSVAAEMVMKQMIREKRINWIAADSAAATREEIGNDVDFRTRHKLEAEGIWCGHHRARQVTPADYGYYDWLVLMEEWNRRELRRIIPEDPEGKVRLLLDWSEWPRDIDDPWYTGDFDKAFEDIKEGCQAMLTAL